MHRERSMWVSRELFWTFGDISMVYKEGGQGGSCHEVTIVNFRFHESRNKKFTFHDSRTCARNCNQNLYKKVHSLTLPIIYSCWKGDI